MKTNHPQKKFWEEFVDALAEPVLVLDMFGKILYANNSACVLFDKKKEALVDSDFSYPLEIAAPVEIDILRSGKKNICAEVYMKTGVWKDEPAWIVTLHDVTDRKNREDKLRISETVFTHAKEGIIITDHNVKIIDINDEFTKITLFSKKDVIGKNPNILKSGKHNKEFFQEMWAHLKKEGYWYGELWNRRKNNELYPQLLAISAVKDLDGDIINYVGVFYDITQENLQKKQLERIAFYDSLTDLPNRVLFTKRLEEAIERLKRADYYLAVIYIDIDDFKQVNDVYGHAIGDALLLKTANMLKNVLRSHDTVARFGGDEFVMLIDKLKLQSDYIYLIDRIYNCFKNPLLIGSHQLIVHVSIGVTFYPQDIAVRTGDLISQADQAMYRAKLSGKNRHVIFNTEVDKKLREKEQIINDLKCAIKNNELVLYYQPKVNMQTGGVFGLEGLIRWHHPEKGILNPDQFLPHIEQDKFSYDLADLTLNFALKQLKDWSKLNDQLTISINMNALQMEQENFVAQLKKILSPYPKSIVSRLELEILESSDISSFKKTTAVIKECNKLGISFSLDDFGTQYSSINYLMNMPLRYMKIDAAFIRNIINNEKNTNLLKAMLEVAKALDLEVIAEGVETDAHIDYLVNLGCILGQGYAISRPMPAQEFPHWYRTYKDYQWYPASKR